MKVIYHEKCREVYSGDPAAKQGRIESVYNELHGYFDFVTAVKADEDDLTLVHSENHIGYVRSLGLYEVAMIAVGGAIKTAEIAFEEPAFGLIRPPGHHASRDSSWGFCYFNNIAIAVERLRKSGRISKALIIDFDLHYGDGTASIFAETPLVSYFHIPSTRSLEALSDHLTAKKNFEMIAVSAGFDRHIEDWGGMMKTEDYNKIGEIIKDCAEEECSGRRFAVLEGGYNHRVLGKNVKAFLEGVA